MLRAYFNVLEVTSTVLFAACLLLSRLTSRPEDGDSTFFRNEVNFYQTVMSYISEECVLCGHCYENIKSNKLEMFGGDTFVWKTASSAIYYYFRNQLFEVLVI
jgi:hypothetical protein